MKRNHLQTLQDFLRRATSPGCAEPGFRGSPVFPPAGRTGAACTTDQEPAVVPDLCFRRELGVFLLMSFLRRWMLLPAGSETVSERRGSGLLEVSCCLQQEPIIRIKLFAKWSKTSQSQTALTHEVQYSLAYILILF